MSKVLDPTAEDNRVKRPGRMSRATFRPWMRWPGRGARQMLTVALEAEFARYIEVHADAREEQDRRASRPQRPCPAAHGDLRGGDDAGLGAADE